MPKSYPRVLRVAELIQTTLAGLLRTHLLDKRMVLVTITSVEVPRDYSMAKVFVSILSDDAAEIKSILKLLNDESKRLRYELAQAVELRTTPMLRFYYDETIRGGRQLSDLLNRIT